MSFRVLHVRITTLNCSPFTVRTLNYLSKASVFILAVRNNKLMGNMVGSHGGSGDGVEVTET